MKKLKSRNPPELPGKNFPEQMKFLLSKIQEATDEKKISNAVRNDFLRGILRSVVL